MRPVRTLDPVAPADRAALSELASAVESADGHSPLGEADWRALDDGRATLFAAGANPLAAAAVLAPSDSFAAPHLALGTVVHPDHRADTSLTALLNAAVDHVAAIGGGRVLAWRAGAGPDTDARFRQAGFEPAREQWQMRVPLPLAEPARWPPGVTVRRFEPGRDEATWLEVNNRAFRNHPEQGGWIDATLRRREAEPWFDPAGFLLAFDADGLAGFCWTKVHPDDGLGEIFVIGVDPSRRRTGLGRALVVGGLEHLHGRGLPTGMLYVDAANRPAVELYRSLGFDVHRVDRAYERIVDGVGSP